METPIIDEVFADNGEHSHWRLINSNGEELCSEEDKDEVERLTILLTACERANESLRTEKPSNDE